MDLSIIIVNYNTLELTKACIESIRYHTKDIEYEIIVVDNASTDGSIKFFSMMKDIAFIESGDNLGFGRANNLGLEHSSGRYVLMLNSDTVIENNILTRMVKRFDVQPKDVACLGSLLLHADRCPSCSFGYYKSWKEEFGKKVEERNTNNIEGAQREVEYVSGADLFVRRNVAKELGLFDPDFFMYYEDMELGYRYRKSGYKSVVVNEHGIIHLEGASSKCTYRKICIITKSYLLYLRKTLSYGEYCVARFCIMIRRTFTVWHYRWSLKDSLIYIKLLISA